MRASRTPKGEKTLQRLFTTFPGGWPGVGLLLLRTAAGVTAVIQGAAYLGNSGTLAADAVGLLAILSGAAVIVGFLTPLASGLVGFAVLGIAFSWLPRPNPNLFDSPLSSILVVAVAASVAFLGPGAISLDARLFGRREIIIPHASRPPHS